jgi:hypothetical protein
MGVWLRGFVADIGIEGILRDNRCSQCWVEAFWLGLASPRSILFDAKGRRQGQPGVSACFRGELWSRFRHNG